MLLSYIVEKDRSWLIGAFLEREHNDIGIITAQEPRHCCLRLKVLLILGRADGLMLFEKKLPDCATSVDSGLQSFVTIPTQYVYLNLLVTGQTKPEYLVLITLEEVGQASMIFPV